MRIKSPLLSRVELDAEKGELAELSDRQPVHEIMTQQRLHEAPSPEVAHEMMMETSTKSEM